MRLNKDSEQKEYMQATRADMGTSIQILAAHLNSISNHCGHQGQGRMRTALKTRSTETKNKCHEGF
jgi:hypothetical protein